MAVRRSLRRLRHGVPRLAAAARPWSAMVGKSSNQVRGVLDEQSTAHTTGVLVNNGLDAEPATKETCSSKETSRTLDFNPSAFDTSAKESVSRVMRGRHASHVRGREWPTCARTASLMVAASRRESGDERYMQLQRHSSARVRHISSSLSSGTSPLHSNRHLEQLFAFIA